MLSKLFNLKRQRTINITKMGWSEKYQQDHQGESCHSVWVSSLFEVYEECFNNCNYSGRNDLAQNVW